MPSNFFRSGTLERNVFIGTAEDARPSEEKHGQPTKADDPLVI